MVLVQHTWKDENVSKRAGDDVKFLLTNKKGGYFLFSNLKRSRYGGFFSSSKGKMYKVADSLFAGGINEISNRFCQVDLKEEKQFSVFMPHSFNSVVLESEEGCEFTLDLDCRESYDVR